MFISFFPFLFLFFIYLLMIVRINITFYLDSYLFKSLALFFHHRADLTCRQSDAGVSSHKPEEKWKYLLQCRNHSEKCLMKFTFFLVWNPCKFFGTFLDTRRDDGVKLAIAGTYIFESPVFPVQLSSRHTSQ